MQSAQEYCGTRIALLLNGCPADVPVSVCAVQLAARTASKLFALRYYWQVEKDNSPSSTCPILDNFRFVAELAGASGVPVSCHLLGNDRVGVLDEFLIVHAITCLVVHAGPAEHRIDQQAWLERLQARLYRAPHRFHGDLQIIMAASREKMNLELTMAQFQKLHSLGVEKKL